MLAKYWQQFACFQITIQIEQKNIYEEHVLAGHSLLAYVKNLLY